MIDGAPARGRARLAVALSVGLHLGLALAVGAVSRAPGGPLRRGETVPIEIVETVRAPPAPAPPPPEPEPPPPRRVVRNPVRGPRDAPPPPERSLPPPPSAPRDDAPSADEATPQVGVSTEGSAGGMAAPAGNTMYGQLPERAPEAKTVKPYRAEATGAPALVTALPEVVDAAVPPEEYPPQARREGREGTVRLRLVVGTDGRVADARVVQDPGYGFGDAAVKVAKRYFRFRAARVGEEPVATEIPFTVRFELP